MFSLFGKLLGQKDEQEENPQVAESNENPTENSIQSTTLDTQQEEEKDSSEEENDEELKQEETASVSDEPQSTIDENEPNRNINKGKRHLRTVYLSYTLILTLFD